MKTFAFLLFLISHAHAECTPKDLTDPEYLKSMGKENLIELFKTPRDQDSVGWCGAFAPADSLSFAVGEAVSPMDVSINYYTSTNRQGTRLQALSGVSTLAATDLAKTDGYCPESVIPSNQTSSSNLGQSALLKLMENFQKIHDDYVAKGKPADYCVNCLEGYERVIKPTLPGATVDVIRDVLQKNQSDSLTAFKDLLNKLCEGRRVVVSPETNMFYKNNSINRMIPNEIDKALDNDSMPNFVMNTSHFASLASLPGGHGDHALMVVARRMGDNGKCEYQIRNSWGKGCSYYQPAIAAKCDPAKGAFWMDEDRLQAGVSSMVIVKNDKSKNFAKKQEEKKAPTLNNGSENKAVEENKISDENKISENNSNNNNIDTNKNNDSNSKPSFGQNVDTFLAKASETASKVAVEVTETAKKVAAGLAEAVSSIWKSLSNAFKY